MPSHSNPHGYPRATDATWRSYLTHLECTYCGARANADELQSVCRACGKVLYARYDLAGVKSAVRREDLAGRRWDMWRYWELLPVRDPANVVSLGEGMTPLIDAPRAAKEFGLGQLLIKEEGQNPTASFKARGLSAAVSRAKELGVPAIALPSAGNAASAAAAYAAAAGMTAHLFMPRDVPEVNRIEGEVTGAAVELVDGLINDAGRRVAELAPKNGWWDVSTLKEPYRQEGKKTMGIELAEQLGWELPDAIVYPTGGGTGIVGMWKAFAELEALGWIGAARPKMISVQAAGCAPIVRAFAAGERHAEPWVGAQTVAAGIRVPVAIGDYLILDAVRESGGTAIAVSEAELAQGQIDLAQLSGLYTAPEGGACVAAVRQLVRAGVLGRSDRVVLFSTGMGIKYPPPAALVS